MNKIDCFATLGLFILLAFIAMFSQSVYEQRNPKVITLTKPKVIIQKIEPIGVTFTAYSPDEEQCQDNPYETASTLIVTPQDLRAFRYVAVSRDLWKVLKEEYGYKWGDDISIYVEFKVVDLMGKTAQGKLITNTIDWFMENEEDALRFGHQEDRGIIILEKAGGKR